MKLALWVAAALAVPATALTQVNEEVASGSSKAPGGGTVSQELKLRIDADADRTVQLYTSKGAQGGFTVIAPDATTQVRALLDGPATGPQVTVHIANQPIREALKQVFEAAHEAYVVDKDVPDDARVSVDAANVRLSTVLQLVTEAAGVGWRREIADGGKTTYRVGKTVRSGWPGLFRVRDGQARVAIEDLASRVKGSFPLIDVPMAYTVAGSVQRSSVFTCPHCKGQVTVLRKQEQPRCPKCGRIFLGDWQFCPVDGTKRPATTGTWRYCPLCGKPVEPQ